MTGPDLPDWAEIRRLYVASGLTVSGIAERHGIPVRRLHARARADGWPRRSDHRPKPKPKPKPSAAAVPSDSGRSITKAKPPDPPLARPAPARKASSGRNTSSLKARRTLVRRLYRAIDTKLQQMETRMAKDIAAGGDTADASAADHERDTRAIGTLIANLSRITEIEADLERASDATPASPDAASLADEAERFRRDVAERLARLVGGAP